MKDTLNEIIATAWMNWEFIATVVIPVLTRM